MANDRPKVPCTVQSIRQGTSDECGSVYFGDTSEMTAFWPECAHQLNGHPPCAHAFEHGRCRHCHWDGSVSPYLAKPLTGR